MSEDYDEDFEQYSEEGFEVSQQVPPTHVSVLLSRWIALTTNLSGLITTKGTDLSDFTRAQMLWLCWILATQCGSLQ